MKEASHPAIVMEGQDETQHNLLVVVNAKISVFLWSDLMQCDRSYRHFGVTFCLHLTFIFLEDGRKEFIRNANDCLRTTRYHITEQNFLRLQRQCRRSESVTSHKMV
jgi:hypothetical protein